MGLLSKLNKPITLYNLSRKYIVNSRPITQEEVVLLKRELDILRKNTEINWGLPRTYIPSLLFSIIALLFSKSYIIAAVSYIVFFIISKVIPFLLKGDSILLRRDIIGDITLVKSGPVTIIEDNNGSTYTKRFYLDDVIIDGIYTKGDTLKYPNLKDGQNIEVTYSPNAQYIYMVRSL